MTNKTLTLLRIGAVARGAGVDTATVRRYVRLGLLDHIQDTTGNLLFGPEAIEAAIRIKAERAANRGSRRLG